MSAIIELSISNVQKLRAVEIRPEGNSVVIGGRNAQGKSSVLDAITYALGGKAKIPPEPIRKGERRAEVVIRTTDDYVVRRTWKAGGGTYLTIVNPEGTVEKSPQQLLNALVGDLTFDPLKFIKKSSQDQVETLRSLCGVNFEALEERKDAAYRRRTVANRELKRYKAELGGCEVFDAPDEHVSVSDLMDELTKRQNEAADQANEREKLAFCERTCDRALEALEKARVRFEKCELELQEQRTIVEQLPELAPIDEIETKIRNATEINRKVDANARAVSVRKKLDYAQEVSDRLTQEIQDCDAEKRRILESIKLPIKELTFDDENGVIYKGVPFEQASQAEKLKVSVALGLFMNPELRIMLIREGSLLDKKSLAMLERLAKARDAQVWIERVSTGKEVSLVIEDGMVADNRLR